MAFEATRYVGVEHCPNGEAVHVVPMRITSGAPIVSLETPGNITAAKSCEFCNPPAQQAPTTDGADR